MRQALVEIWGAFWSACKETPRGMFEPLIAFWHAATHCKGSTKQRQG